VQMKESDPVNMLWERSKNPQLTGIGGIEP
jgi:hypothetical protein